MARIEDIVSNIPDANLRTALFEEIRRLKETKHFGLVFEEHLPESVALPDSELVIGSLAMHIASSDSSLWLITAVEADQLSAVPVQEQSATPVSFSREEMIAVQRFGDPVYPTLSLIDKLSRTPGRPSHVILEADNYHALQLLRFTHRGLIDLIYIDPPYNTGAKDWKYNNSFVDRGDSWKHSKWLSFMKKRLEIAKDLLRSDGVLIVAIDDYEVHHLGMLLESLFTSHTLETLVIEHHPQGAGSETVSRTHEYAFVCVPRGGRLEGRKARSGTQKWPLRRSGQGENNWRQNRPKQFFSILIDPVTLDVKGVGPEIGSDDEEFPRDITNEGYLPIYPIDGEGKQRVWRYNRQSMRKLIDEGKIVCSPRHSLSVLRESVGATPLFSVWTGARYNAGLQGSSLLTEIMGTPNSFPYPKSLYTVLDMLEMVVGNRSSSIILDFFGGSGTTIHATALLNSMTDASHQCILVTNNDVSEAEARALSRAGLKPGEAKWEAHGICKAVTWPRCKFAVQGFRDDGTTLSGDYADGGALGDGFPENLSYLKLAFGDPNQIALGMSVNAILPVLWLAAGAVGDIPKYEDGDSFVFGAAFSVLLREEKWPEFVQELKARHTEKIFIATDSDDNFRLLASRLPTSASIIQLYRSYLDSFAPKRNASARIA